MGVPTEKLPAEKDVTDTHFAVMEALKRRPDPSSSWERSARGSITRCPICSSWRRWNGKGCAGKSATVTTGFASFAADPFRVRKSRYRYLSLLPLSDTVSGVTLTGFRYPLTEAVLRRSDSLGVSNELVEEEGEIRLRSGMLFVIESRD